MSLFSKIRSMEPLVQDTIIDMNKFLVARVAEALPSDVLGALKEMPARVCVGGGFIRSMVQGEPAKDVDLFVSDEEAAEWVKARLSAGRETTLDSRNATTYQGNPPVQVVTRWMYPPEEHIRRFDFTIAQACVWWSVDRFVGKLHERFIEDATERRLVYTAPEREEEPLGSVIRKDKFIAQGYTMSAHQWAKLMARTEQRLQEARETEGYDATDEVPMSMWTTWALRAGGGGGY